MNNDWSAKIRKTAFFTLEIILIIIDYAIIFAGYFLLFNLIPYFWGKAIVILIICAVTTPRLYKIIFNLIIMKILHIFARLFGLKDEDFKNSRLIKKREE